MPGIPGASAAEAGEGVVMRTKWRGANQKEETAVLDQFLVHRGLVFNGGGREEQWP